LYSGDIVLFTSLCGRHLNSWKRGKLEAGHPKGMKGGTKGMCSKRGEREGNYKKALKGERDGGTRSRC